MMRGKLFFFIIHILSHYFLLFHTPPIASIVVLNKMCMPKLPPAPPPHESILFVFTVLLAAITLSPGIDKIDEIATVQTISTPLFPNIVSKRTLGLTRLSIAAIFFLATCYRIFTRG